MVSFKAFNLIYSMNYSFIQLTFLAQFLIISTTGEGNQNVSSPDNRVELTLYYESLCGFSRKFFRTQLWPTYQDLSGLMAVELVPYGNTRVKRQHNSWVFSCQHGEEECYGNIVQTCALKLIPEKAVEFISCIEISHDRAITGAILKCSILLNVDLHTLHECMRSRTGNEWHYEMAVKTRSLNPPHSFVPWITLNGVHTSDIQTRATRDLRALICDSYMGEDRPDSCL